MRQADYCGRRETRYRHYAEFDLAPGRMRQRRDGVEGLNDLRCWEEESAG